MNVRNRVGSQCLAVLLMITTAAVLAPSPSDAYLSVIREGPESRDLAQSGDQLGVTLVTGDFNNDGYDDLATAAPRKDNDLGPASEHGAVIVNYGSARGLTHTGAGWLTVGAVNDVSVRYGQGLAVGDFNHDGYDDLAVGLPLMNEVALTVLDAGEVWIHLGGATGLQSVPSMTLNQGNAGDAIEAGDQFGWSLASGDFDGDTFDDLAVGAPGEDSGSGAVSVFRGAAAGLTVAGSITRRPLQFGSTPEAGGGFGRALAAGNLYDTLHEDLAIGAPFRMVAGLSQAGMVFVVRGSATGLLTTGALIYDENLMSGQAGTGALFGFSLAIGRLRGNPPRTQLVVGEPLWDGIQADAGRVSIIDDFVPPYGAGSFAAVLPSTQGAENSEAGDEWGYAVAVGDWNLDGWDDLAIGMPYENIENQPTTGMTSLDAGRVVLYNGGTGFPGLGGFVALHARALNDTIVTSDRLGEALAFGRFDDTGRWNLAAGCPGKDYQDYRLGADIFDAGQVYIVAPWRQLANRPHRSSVALDCNGQIVFAQRPFQSVPPASITKAMTVLLAVEAIQSGAVDSNFVYDVPEWVANSNKVSGSQAGLLEGQQIRFVDLIKLAISVSAGDACYAIGDILTGGGHAWVDLENTIPGFSLMMNNRADQLGMNNTNFTNPSGRPLVNHFTSAYDFALLARASMANPLFRYFASTTVWADIPNWPVTTYGWLQDMQGLYSEIDGIKPGGNQLALKTGLWHATDDDSGRVVAAAFGIPAIKYGSPNDDSPGGTGADLIILAASECGPGFAPPPTTPPPPGPWSRHDRVPTGPGPTTCLQAFLEEPATGDAQIELYPRTLASTPAHAQVVVSRTSEVRLGAGAQVVLGFTGGVSHGGIRVGNAGTGSARLVFTPSQPAGPQTIVLGAGNFFLLPAVASLSGPYSLTIGNTSSTSSALLELEELGYAANAVVSLGSPAVFTLKRDPGIADEIVTVCVDGQDPTAGNDVLVLVRSGGATLAVDPDLAPVTGTPARLVLLPNPFRESCTLAFSLAQASPVSLHVYDLTGRRVRTLEPGAWRPPGEHRVSWDGRDDDGRRVRAGMYFVKLATNTEERLERTVYLR